MSRKYIKPIAIALLLFVFDRALKYIFVNRFVDKVGLLDWLGLELKMNDGLAFGFLSGHGLIISLVGIIIFLYFLYLYFNIFKNSEWSLVGLGMVLSGALSNLLDRFIYDGYVVDYINVTFYSVFNVADVAIVVGLVILLFNFFHQQNHTFAKRS